MPIRFLCPMGHPLVVPDDLAGTEGRCPTCRQRVLIPVTDPDVAETKNAASFPEAIQPVDVLATRSAHPPAISEPPAWSGLAGELADEVEPPSAANPVDSAPILPPPLPKGLADRYVAPPERIRLAYGIAVIAGVLAFVTAMPAFGELQHPPAPGWVWILILLWLVQVGYAFWLASLPDWSTVWLGMVLYALLATLAAIGLVVAIATPTTRTLPLALDDVRQSLAPWSAMLLLFDGALACAAGWISARWRREYVAARTLRARDVSPRS